MGYSIFRIPAKRLPLPEWIPELSERDFQDRFFRDVRVIAYNRTTRAAYNQVFAAYLRDAASDGLADGTWRYERGAFHFAFPDHGGSAMSSAASVHFVEVGTALKTQRPTIGWRLKPKRTLFDVLNHNPRPLVEIGKTLYVIDQRRGTFSLTTDEGLPTKEWSELSKKDQARFAAMWSSKTCGCQLCEYYRPRTKAPVAEKTAGKKPAVKSAARK